MIPARRLQRSFGDGLISEAVEDLWEPWMRHADKALQDEALLLIIQHALAHRCKKSKTRGRPGTPAEVVLRMMLLKHARDWSYEELTREVRANLVYREFTRIGGEKVPDDKTMGRLGRQLGPEVVEKVNERMVQIARENGVTTGRKLRVDTTVVETNIHYPTDSSLLGDGARLLTRVLKQVSAAVGEVGTKLRDRMRSVKRCVVAIARSSRNQTEKGKEKLKQSYVKLLDATSRILGQAKKFSHAIAEQVKQGSPVVLRRAKKQLDEMIPRVQQVIRQTRERVFGGNTRAAGKLLSIFEPHTEVIRKGKANKPNEFGKLVKIQEAENQIITHYQVCQQRPADSTLLVPSLEQHIKQFGRAPEAIAADPGFFSAANEAKAEEMGARRVSIPSHATKSPARKQRQGLQRSRYRGPDSIQRWVGFGVIADNAIHIGCHMAAKKG